MAAATPPSQRTLNQIVRDLDPDYDKEKIQPIVLRFSNGREFKRVPNPYA